MPATRVESGQVVGDRDRAFLAPAQATELARLGGVGGPLGIVGEAVGPVALGAGPAAPAVGHEEGAGPPG